MAKKKQEDPPKGAPAWMNTFSDLMNLLLCFFVLLFSMSTVDTDKLEAVVASLQNAISILPTGGTSIGEGEMISAGVRQLEFLDSYYNEMANSKAENTDVQTDGKLSAQEQYEQEQLAESEKMADEIQQELDNSQLSGKVDVDFNAEYVKLNLNGSILFASGKADLVKQAVPIVNKLGKILEKYNKNVIEVEGHTDNVPIRYSAKYENNEVLSVYRALAVTDQLRKNKNLNPKYIKFAGRGDYIPVADNSTAEGRAQNRRVEIKIYNSFNSDVTMKKNLISVVILALVFANFVLTALLMFSVLPETKKANTLIEKVCSAIDLDLNSGAATGTSNVSIDDQEIYKVSTGEDLTTNLAEGKDGKTHYAVLNVSLVLNKKSDNYKKYTQDFLTNQDDTIKNDIIKVVSGYTFEQFNQNSDVIKDTILEDMQNLFGKDYVIGVNFSKLTAQ